MSDESRRERSRRAKQARIAAAAAELFRLQGYAAATTEQIAELADVAKGTVFRYAPTKLHLLVMVYEADLEAAVAQAFAAPAGPAVVEALLAVFGHFFTVYERDAGLARLFVQAQLFPPDPPPPAAALETLFGRLVGQIGAWQAAGLVRAAVDPALAAQTTFALYLVVAVGWLSGRLSAAERDAQLRASFELHWGGLLGPDAPAASQLQGDSL